MAYNQRLTNSTDRDCDTAADSALTTVAPVQTTSQPEGTTQPTAETTPPPEGTTAPPNNDESGRSRRRQSERGVHSDYLLIPDGLYSGSRFASKYCDKSLENFDDSTGNHDRNLFIPLFFLKGTHPTVW